jgi:hypothetical protein
MRRRRQILPPFSVISKRCCDERAAGRQLVHEVLTNGLVMTPSRLDALLARRGDRGATWLSWLRNAPQSPAARNILRLIERLAYIRALGLDRARADMIPALTFDRLADEAAASHRSTLANCPAPPCDAGGNRHPA